VPLLDNDSAHHATIALNMHLTGDYWSLVDHKGDYLDKPHLLFWLSSLSYKVFGVTTFAYKLPSFLFTIAGTYSTYKLGTLLYTKETGKLAALIVASSFAYMLANNDVRMDAILTASIIFSVWQLTAFVKTDKWFFLLGAALGLSLGFATKGLIGVAIPTAGTFFHILYLKKWSLLYYWKWLLLILLFFLLISPVLYAYYHQFNLHPEKVVRNKSNIDGIRFILWGQNFERFNGSEFGNSGKKDPFFFVHSFLWAFFPWCILAYIAIVKGLRGALARKQEWLTLSVFLISFIAISLSGFKLPHYLNIVFPVSAIIVASFILENEQGKYWLKRIPLIQAILVILVLLFITILNTWAFPIRNPLLVFLLLSITALLYTYIIKYNGILQKTVLMSIASMIISFFALNANFYLQLLRFQGGNELAFKYRDVINTQEVYLWNGLYSPSWNFYTATQRKIFNDNLYSPHKKLWLLCQEDQLTEIRNKGYTLGRKYSTSDYGIGKLKISFINPDTREKVCTKMILTEILSKN
jgi:4-amino-4-deoxy-L-arabinose transferase-like glycosyltransferase